MSAMRLEWFSSFDSLSGFMMAEVELHKMVGGTFTFLSLILLIT